MMPSAFVPTLQVLPEQKEAALKSRPFALPKGTREAAAAPRPAAPAVGTGCCGSGREPRAAPALGGGERFTAEKGKEKKESYEEGSGKC